MADLNNNQAVAQAFTRFGLGGRPDDALPSDATTWLLQQLDGPDPMPTAGLPTLADCMSLIHAYGTTASGSSARKVATQNILNTLNAEILAFLTYAMTTQLPFRERLVWFWTNHFALLTGTVQVQALAGTFVRDCIRPNINGTFADMLLAVMQHPAMMFSLDNYLSVGPNSSYAINHFKNTGVQLGINENLGRELLELHTVGVNAGYTQADVDGMAYLLTGWSVENTNPQGFFYQPTWQQPGSQTVLGNAYPGSFAGTIQALTDLATSSDTYNHLATELVQHFVSDTPDPGDVGTVQSALQQSGGNLQSAMAAVVGLKSAWVQLTKFRPPLDHAIAVLRAIGTTASGIGNPGGIMATLGQPTWNTPFPNGWSDLMADWLCPAQMVLRADWTASISAGLGALDPLTIASSCLGPFLTPLTTQLMGQLTSVPSQFHVLFCSPEFQRR